MCFTLAVAAEEVVSLYRPILEPLGLTHSQCLVMVTLWETDEPISAKQLSKLLMLEAPSLSPLWKRMEAAGLVERHRDLVVERWLQESFNDGGIGLTEQARGIPVAIIERLGMTPQKLENLQDVLTEDVDRAKALTRPVPPGRFHRLGPLEVRTQSFEALEETLELHR